MIARFCLFDRVHSNISYRQKSHVLPLKSKSETSFSLLMQYYLNIYIFFFSCLEKRESRGFGVQTVSLHPTSSDKITTQKFGNRPIQTNVVVWRRDLQSLWTGTAISTRFDDQTAIRITNSEQPSASRHGIIETRLIRPAVHEHPVQSIPCWIAQWRKRTCRSRGIERCRSRTRKTVSRSLFSEWMDRHRGCRL